MKLYTLGLITTIVINTHDCKQWRGSYWQSVNICWIPSVWGCMHWSACWGSWLFCLYVSKKICKSMFPWVCTEVKFSAMISEYRYYVYLSVVVCIFMKWVTWFTLFVMQRLTLVQRQSLTSAWLVSAAVSFSIFL